MLKIRTRRQFDKDYKRAIKRGLNPKDLRTVLDYLINQKPLPMKYKNHKLENSKDYKNMQECHINPDWLLIYTVKKDELVLELVRTGSHSDLY